jgi:diguanylate cyclase (GGDEF)-like protein
MTGSTIAGRRGLRLLQGTVLAGLAALLASTLSGTGNDHPALDAWLTNGVTAGAALVCLARAWGSGSDRLAWTCLAVALALFEAGGLYWTIWLRPLETPPFPSLYDWLALSFYPFAFAALVLLVRARVRRFHASMWLDGLIGGLGAAALTAALALGPILQATGGSAAAVAVTIAYPTFDLLLLGMVVGVLALLGWRPPPAWWLLVAGLVIFALADTVYLFQVASGTYVPGTILDPLWQLATVLMAFTPGRDSRVRELRLQGRAVAVLPALFTLASVAVLVRGQGGGVPAVATLLAAATVLGALGRLVLTLRETQALHDSRRQARTDDLTGLANRRAFYEQAGATLATARERLALLLVDLDRFKEVNDSLGHHVGDQLLAQLGPRLTAATRPGDVVARLGGDEFGLLLPGTDGAAATTLAARVRERLQVPFMLDGMAVHVDASIGVALFPDHGNEVNTLLQRADIAMYVAKAARSGCQLYAPEGDRHSRYRLQLREELRAALAGGQLLLHYQPKVELDSGAVTGVEALVRWAHPSRGLLYPDAFLPLVEEAGLMRDLNWVVLDLALEQVRDWRAEGLNLTVAVNLSASSVVDAELPELIGGLLSGRALPAGALQVEITEDFLMSDHVRAREVLGELRKLGVRVGIDDYGTGYSSLAYLRELPVDELKLDRSFVFAIADDRRAAAIVRSTVQLAHSLGMEMVAEGVETEAALGELRRFGCDLAQGYLLSRPVPASELERWMLERRDSRVPAPRHRDGAARTPSRDAG